MDDDEGKKMDVLKTAECKGVWTCQGYRKAKLVIAADTAPQHHTWDHMNIWENLMDFSHNLPTYILFFLIILFCLQMHEIVLIFLIICSCFIWNRSSKAIADVQCLPVFIQHHCIYLCSLSAALCWLRGVKRVKNRTATDSSVMAKAQAGTAWYWLIKAMVIEKGAMSFSFSHACPSTFRNLGQMVHVELFHDN